MQRGAAFRAAPLAGARGELARVRDGARLIRTPQVTRCGRRAGGHIVSTAGNLEQRQLARDILAAVSAVDVARASR